MSRGPRTAATAGFPAPKTGSVWPAAGAQRQRSHIAPVPAARAAAATAAFFSVGVLAGRHRRCRSPLRRDALSRPVTAELSKELREVFELADADENGKISPQELLSALRVLGISTEIGRVRQVVRDLDRDGDGEINFDEFVGATGSSHSDLILRAVNRGRFLSRWSALLFECDETDTRSVKQWAKAARSLERLTDSDMSRLLDDRLSPTNVVFAGSFEEEEAKPQELQEIPHSWSENYWPSGPIARTGHLAQLFLCEVAIVLLSWKFSAFFVSRLLRRRLVVVCLKPLLTGRFLTLLFRHRRARRAMLVFLRTEGVEHGVVNVLYLDTALVELCREQDTAEILLQIVGRRGMGSFLRRFIVAVPPDLIRRFLQHKATAKLVAQVVLKTKAEASAAWAHRRRQQLPAAVCRACRVPGAELWAMNFCATPGIDQWLGELLNDPRGAGFAKRLLLQDGFLDKVADFLSLSEARRFVLRLLRQPGVYRFVTWLNRDKEMQKWFARIAKREDVMLFITEMLQEPGLDKFIVKLLLRRGNDKALRSMLDFWVHTEGSFASVFGSFSKKPGVDRALARVVISPGFLDGFVFRKFLWQEGLANLALEAAALVGVRGLVDTVLPLAFGVVLAIVAFYFQGVFRELDFGSLDFGSLEPFLGAAVEEVSFLDFVVPFVAGLVSAGSFYQVRKERRSGRLPKKGVGRRRLTCLEHVWYNVVPPAYRFILSIHLTTLTITNKLLRNHFVCLVMACDHDLKLST
ncbi:unnamed protein product [Cladocopium goreaui]|uniref:EF-hand domain-containing protein n=1 Tax=Cladocopium goreaui TaxID=2562237 RepID=A0A9P1CJW9_9DINO|nr:unnamed protein product [Cladocopium goreaui]